MKSTRGVIPTPNVLTEELRGGHCMLIIGYNDATQTFTCANSWGGAIRDTVTCRMRIYWIQLLRLTFAN